MMDIPNKLEPEVDSPSTPVRLASPAPKKKLRRTVEEKRKIVEETLAAGASVARVARERGVNANQVFQWRRLYRAGGLGGQGASKATVNLLPVTVADAPVGGTTHMRGEPSSPALPGTIHLKLPNAHIRIDGSSDAAWLHMVLECLLR